MCNCEAYYIVPWHVKDLTEFCIILKILSKATETLQYYVHAVAMSFHWVVMSFHWVVLDMKVDSAASHHLLGFSQML